MAELTVIALSKKIHKRAEAAARKKLISRLGEAGRHFFAEHHRGRYVVGVEVKTLLHYDETSCTTSWEWEVTCYTKVKGKSQIRLRYDLAGWGADTALVELIHENGKVVPVLKARKMTESHTPAPAEIASDGWLYETYIPGNWERYLNGPKLEEVAVARQNAEGVKRERLSKAEKKRRLLEPVSDHIRQEVLANYGIK